MKGNVSMFVLRWIEHLNNVPILIIATLVFGALGAAIAMISRRFVFPGSKRDDGEEKLAETVHTSILGFSAFILALALTSAFSNLAKVEEAIMQEALDISRLSRELGGLGAPAGTAQAALKDYTRRVADEEWKSLGQTPPLLSPAAGQDLDTVWAEVRKLQANAALVPEHIRAPLNTFLERIESARRSRLSFATYSLPEIFWTLIILFFIAAAIMDARHPHRRFGVAMIASHMAVIGVVIALVMIVDNPFSGQASIDPGIIRNALAN